MLPNPTDTTGTANPDYNPVKRDFNDLDSLIGELNAPKEVILSAAEQASVIPGVPPISGAILPEMPAEQITPEQAARTGERIAKTFNTVFGFGASTFAKSEDRKLYEADNTDVHDLSRAWSDVAMKYSFKIEDSPWVNLVILIVAVYAPIALKAKTDRGHAILQEQIETMRKEQEKNKLETQARLAKLEEEKTA